MVKERMELEIKAQILYPPLLTWAVSATEETREIDKAG